MASPPEQVESIDFGLPIERDLSVRPARRRPQWMRTLSAWVTRHIVRLRSWGCSAMVHLGIAIVLACLVPPLDVARREISAVFVSQEAGAAGAVEFDSPAEPGDLYVEDAGASPSTSLGPSSFVSGFDRQDGAQAATRLAAIIGTGGTGQGTSGEGMGPGGTGSGLGGKVGFFGTSGTGNSVVFVVDMSMSMMEGNRFPRATQELIRAVNKLHPTQKFYVIFFNSDYYSLFAPKPAKGLVLASPAMKKRATKWINSLSPNSFTNPEPALQRALQLKPDMIYFLSDGEIPLTCRETAKKLNSRKTAIHTIAFGGREGEQAMQAIARDNNGTFRFVP